MADEVITTPFGKFLINPQDCIGTTLKAGRLWDGAGFLQPIAREYGRLGEPGVTILDVGANIGTYSVWLARQGAWRVIAVEPVPETLLYLKANLDLNVDVCGDVVIPLEVAAWDHSCRLGPATPFDPDNMGATALVEQAGGGIQAAPLDSWDHLWNHGTLSLIKIDTQGSDFRVLRGLGRTLRVHRPVIVFEWEAGLAQVHGHTFGDATGWLAEQGYTVLPWPCYANNFLARPR